jgi:hypothetical protein
MPQLSKISQRRLLLDQFYAKILIMPSTESERCRPPILMASKKWSAYRQNWWSAWFRTSGRHPSELMVGMSQNMQPTSLLIRPVKETYTEQDFFIAGLDMRRIENWSLKPLFDSSL